MKTVAVTINKGGAGKTMFARTLAVAADQAGLLSMILDLDSQENSKMWSDRRIQQHNEPMPAVKFTTERNLKEEIKNAEAAGCDILFIDTPPGRSAEALAAVEEADIVLIPFWPFIDYYEGATRSNLVARRMGKKAFGVLNMAQPNARIEEENSRAVCNEIGLPFAPVVMHRYKAHELAHLRGQTILELEPDGIPAQEARALWAWLCAQLQIGTTEQHGEEAAA